MIFEVISKNIPTLHYDDGDIKEVENGDGTDVSYFMLKPITSGWGYLVISDGTLNVVVGPPQITSCKSSREYVKTMAQSVSSIIMLDTKYYIKMFDSFLGFCTKSENKEVF